MTGLMFPKSQTKRKKRQHRDSILQKKDGRCWLCMRLHGDYTQKAGIHKHHVFFGQGQREISEANGSPSFCAGIITYMTAGPKRYTETMTPAS